MITSKNRWWIRGLFFCMFLFLFMSVLLPLAQEEELTAKGLIFPLLYWTTAGLVLQWINSFIDQRRKATKKETSQPL